MEAIVPAAVVLIACAIHYAFGRYSYEVVDDTLRMRLRILRVVPWGRRTVKLSDIKGAKRFSPREDWRYGWDLFGNVLTKKSVFIQLKRRLIGGILVTPADPDAFVVEISRLIQARPRPEA